MKALFYLFVFLFLSFSLFGQSKDLENAVKNGKDPQNNTYFAKFSRPQEKVDVQKWIDKKGYILLKGKEISFPQFGDMVTGYDNVYFMTKPDYNYAMEVARKTAEQHSREARTTSVDMNELIPLILGGAALIYGGYKLLEASADRSSPSSSGGSSTPSYSGNKNQPTITPDKESYQSKKECYTIKAKKYFGDDQAYEYCYIDNKRITCPVYVITCSNGTEKEYYYQSEYTPNHISQQIQGYYQNVVGPDPYLGTDLEKAKKKLCNCE